MKDLTVYSQEELTHIQALEYSALKIIASICDDNQIEYFLIGGTTLGAVRHGGFIPWDDDIDVGMTRENYKRFLKIAPNILPKGYVLQTPYEGTKNPYFYSKVRINGTKFVEYCNHRLYIHHGVYVDIFPFDEIPDDEKLNAKQFVNFQKNIRLFSLRQSPDVSTEPNNIKEYMKSCVRKMLHCVAKLYPYDALVNKLEKESMKYNGTGQSALACLNFPKRKVEYIKKSDLYPLVKKKFIDEEFYVPGNNDVYLRTHYGNYMELPPEEQRFGHKPYCVELNYE